MSGATQTAGRSAAKQSPGRRSIAGLSVMDVVLGLAILSLLIAVFAPAALRRRVFVNEAVAVGGLKSIYLASAAYYAMDDSHRYPSKLGELRGEVADLLPADLAAGTKSGYVFSLTGHTGTEELASFTAEAHPTVYRREGVRSFFIDDSGRLLGADIGGFPGHASMQPWQGPAGSQEVRP